jgi:hypothetical protein
MAGLLVAKLAGFTGRSTPNKKIKQMQTKGNSDQNQRNSD